MLNATKNAFLNPIETETEKPKMGTKALCEKSGMERDAWSSLEDEILLNHVQVYGEGNWRDLPKRAGLNRCGKSCKIRWLNYLKPRINRGNISLDEEELIIRLHKLLGNRWSIIAGRLPGRSEDEIENFWNTYLSKKVKEKHNNNKLPSTSVTNKPQSPMCTKKASSVIIPTTTESPHPVIKPQAVRFTKAIMLTQAANGVLNTMNLTGWDSQNPSLNT